MKSTITRFTLIIAPLLALTLLLTIGACDNFPGVGTAGRKAADGSEGGLAEHFGFSKDHRLVMGMNAAYAPLQYVDDNGTPCGYDVEFTKLLMNRMGIPFTFSPNHWNKMSPGVISGEFDLGMLVYSSYRKTTTNYSNAVFRLYYQIVYRKADYSDFDFRHLKGKRIAYMKSRPIGTMLKESEAIGDSITDLRQAFIDLADGRYDGLICYRFQAKYNISQLHLESILGADELSLEPREYCYASSNAELIDSINAELRRMEAEGLIDEVYGQDVVSQFDIIRIPVWVWWMLVIVTFLFLVIFSVNRYRYGKKLQLANLQLQQANLQLQQANREMGEKNEALQVANARAEESTRMKSDFIKQISHEIRTPLNIISGFTQLMAADGMMSEKEKKESARQVVENTDRITGLVNKMLELSEINSHTVLERRDTVTLLDIIHQAVASSGITDAPHVNFEMNLGEGTDLPFKTDRLSAVRIVELLLDNARKFTQPAEAYLSGHGSTASGQSAAVKKERVTLTASVEPSSVGEGATGRGVMARIVVEDTGKGIPAEEAEHIFGEFVQLDEYYDGTGIGLSVARSLARRLGGDVVLDTTYTSGARFIYSFAYST